MTEVDLKQLLERVQSWPSSAQEELVSIADEIEGELQSGDYVATADELQAIDEAILSLDAGHVASEAEVDAAFAKFLGK